MWGRSDVTTVAGGGTGAGHGTLVGDEIQEGSELEEKDEHGATEDTELNTEELAYGQGKKH